ncbi:MAG TPA: RluA family pseudouridine synthase [Pyrinomonadaceae bacterium]|jgi:23S rRNA pseudouridine1911/1915/1917 synthase|nr:RluA family pseudouridine synthase [Pyrinomonadaceae bacterium]
MDEQLQISAVDQETETLSLRVSEDEAGARLDAYLAAHIEGWSRSRIQRLIEDGDVLLAGRAAGLKSSYKLRSGDEIEVELAPAAPSEFAPENIPLEIVYEDDELVVVNKPAGMVVHPAAGAPNGTLANALAHHFQQLSSRAGATRPGIVHRLDRDTSGLIVVAKTEEAHENLSDQFREREVFKSYVALVHGSVAPESGRIDQPLARDPRQRTRMAVLRGGRPALSLYRVRQRYERFTLLDVEIKTGRTHQIRVHLQWLKHPVVGDKVYGEGRDKSIEDVRVRAALSATNRQFLHAARLGFRHPRSLEPLRFEAPLPAELEGFLRAIRPKAP